MSRPLRVPRLAAAALVVSFTVLPGCSVRKMAVNRMGDALADGGGTFARDDDPDLVRDAAPFSLKTVEALLDEAPKHRGLLLAAASGYARYAFAFIQQEADFAEAQDLARATALRERAAKLYLRARGYGLRGIELDFPGFAESLRRDARRALAPLRARHVPFLYWTALGWSGAMSLRKSDSSLTADQDLAEALMKRALELDEGFELGGIHDFFIRFEGERSKVGGSVERAREHYARALALAGGLRVWPHLSLAEFASVAVQDRAEFERLLREALAFDPDRAPEHRLSNVVAQRRARWLLSRADELFVE